MRACLPPLVVAALLLSPGASRSAEPSASAAWTLLLYHDADCNLEAPMMDDLKEMFAAGGSKDVNVLALVDRHPSGSAEGGFSDEGVGGLQDWDTAKILRVDRGRLVALEDVGEVNMGDPEVLQAFLQFGVQNFPARHYGLIFSDHGSSWPGVCADESSGNDMLSLEEIGSALRGTTSTTGKLDLIGFDACLMANLEVAHAVAPYAHVLVASEELEPGSGWSYTPVLEGLTRNPEMGASDLGALIARTFQESFTKSKDPQDRKEGRGITLSVTDLDQVEALTTAVQKLADVGRASIVGGGRDAWIDVAKARSRAEEYGRSGAPGSEGHAVFDLGDLVGSLATSSRDPTIREAAQGVQAALKRTVLHSVHGNARPAAQGLSIFFPRDSAGLAAAYEKTPFGQTRSWVRFLRAATGVADADESEPEVTAVASSEESIEPTEATTITASTPSIADVEAARFVLAERQGDAVVIIGAVAMAPDDDGEFEIGWDGRWFTIEAGSRRMVCPVTAFDAIDEQGTTFLADVPVQVRVGSGDEWQDLTLTFFLDLSGGTVKGELLYAFAFGVEGPLEVEFEAGDVLRPVYLRVDAEGNEDPVVSTDVEDLLTVEEGMTLAVGYDRVPNGEYLIGVLLTDFAGNAGTGFTAVAVE